MCHKLEQQETGYKPNEELGAKSKKELALSLTRKTRLKEGCNNSISEA